MIKFDSNKNVLTLKKVDFEEHPDISRDICARMNNDYRRYFEEKLEEDIKYLEDAIKLSLVKGKAKIDGERFTTKHGVKVSQYKYTHHLDGRRKINNSIIYGEPALGNSAFIRDEYASRKYTMDVKDEYYPLNLLIEFYPPLGDSFKGMGVDKPYYLYTGYPWIKFPYMDSRGVLTFDRKQKVLLRSMVSDMDISFKESNSNNNKSWFLEAKLEKMKFVFSIDGKRTKVSLKINKGDIDAETLLIGMAREYKELTGIDHKISDIITNSWFVFTSQRKASSLDRELEGEYKTHNIQKYVSLLADNTRSERQIMRVGRARKNINDTLVIDYAEGETLAKDVHLPREEYEGRAEESCVIRAGRTLTTTDIMTLKRNCVDRIYVKYVPKAAGMIIVNPVKINTIQKGTYIKEDVAVALNLGERAMVVPETLSDLSICKGVIVTDDIMEFITNFSSVDEVIVNRKGGGKKGESSKNIPIKLYREVLGNRSFSLSDLEMQAEDFFGIKRNGRFNEDIYIYVKEGGEPWKNPELFEEDTRDHLDFHDMLALVSLMLRTYDDREHPAIRHIDIDFLKRVKGIDEMFSEAFREAVKQCFITSDSIATMNRKLLNQLNRLVANPMNLKESKDELMKEGENTEVSFFGLHKEFKKYLQSSTLLASVEDNNPSALYSQLSRVVTIMPKHTKTPTVQTLALPYFGRIDPYETPAGSKIGLNNALTASAVVNDGKVYATYYKVIKNDKLILTDKVYVLNSKEETKFKIADITSFNITGTTTLTGGRTALKFEPTMVTARVPAEIRGERPTIENVISDTVDYVTATAEPHCSTTTLLVPFAAANDGVRNQYALNLIRQSSPLLYSEAPIVTTPMYSEMYTYTTDYALYAEHDGVVTMITSNEFIVNYDIDGGVQKEYKVNEIVVSKNCYIPVNYKVTEGQRFKKGDLLADSCVSRDGDFSIGAHGFVIYMPYRGRNYEDALPVSRRMADKLVSVKINSVEQEFAREKCSVEVQDLDNAVTFYRKGDPIVKMNVRKNTATGYKETEEEIKASKNGIHLAFKKVDDGERSVKITDYMIAFNKLEPGDKLSGRHGNKGVNPIIIRNSEMPKFMNGEFSDVLMNPCGTVSRMNIGQLLEAHVGFVGYLLNLKISSPAFNGASNEEVRNLVHFVYDIANSDNYQTVTSKWSSIFPKELIERGDQRKEYIRTWRGCFDRECRATVYDPVTHKVLPNKIQFGYTYILKVDHEVDDKVHVREGVATSPNIEYVRSTNQAPRGKTSQGGLRVGEMESAVFAAQGASCVLEEMYTVKADHIESKTLNALELYGLGDAYDVANIDVKNKFNIGVESLIVELEALGLVLYECDDEEGYDRPVLNDDYINSKVILPPREVIDEISVPDSSIQRRARQNVDFKVNESKRALIEEVIWD